MDMNALKQDILSLVFLCKSAVDIDELVSQYHTCLKSPLDTYVPIETVKVKCKINP